MAVLQRFTSVFTHTGDNLSATDAGRVELTALNATAPALARRLKPLVVAHHRVRRLLGGVYAQAPFEFALHTQANPGERVVRRAAKPSFRWRW